MDSSYKQENEFRDRIFGHGSLLDEAAKYICDNFTPRDVWGDELPQKIQDDESPGGMFTENELSAWALDNGFTMTE